MMNNVKNTVRGGSLSGAVYSRETGREKKNATGAQAARIGAENAAPQRLDQGLFVRSGGPTSSALQEYLERLRKDFPDIAIDIRDLTSDADIRRYASGKASGKYLVLAPDFMEWMMAGAQAYEQGKDFISQALKLLGQDDSFVGSQGIVISENGVVSAWWAPKEEKDEIEALKKTLDNIKERMRKAQEEAQKKPKIVIKKHIGYSTGRDMARLARVSSVRDVRSIISGVYAGIYRLKAAGDQYDGDALRQTVTQMEGVVRSARSKIKNLDQEGVAEKRIKKAMERQQKERAMRMRIELAKKRAARRSREHAAIFEPLTPETIERMCRQEEEYAQYLEQIFPADAMSQALGVDMAGAAPAAAPAGTGGGVQAAVVQSVDVSV